MDLGQIIKVFCPRAETQPLAINFYKINRYNMARLSYISEISSELLNNEFIFRDMFVPKPSRFSELFACLAPCYNYLDQELLRRSGSFSVNFLSKMHVRNY